MTGTRHILAIAIAALGLCAVAPAGAKTALTCRDWRAIAGPEAYRPPAKGMETMSRGQFWPTDPYDVAAMTEPEKIAAIDCLLGAERDRRRSSFGNGLLSLSTSDILGEIPTSVAALYLISYIYVGDFNHAAVINLSGEHANYRRSTIRMTKSSAIRRAYVAYRAWFATVRRIGLDAARAAGLQPLDGTKIGWG